MRNIIITGGGIVNKGAQAMTFITVIELKRRFPNHDIYLYDTENNGNKLKDYSFKAFGWIPLKYAEAQRDPIQKIKCLIKNRKNYVEITRIFCNCDLIVDISGYALSSNWEDKICNDFLKNIEFAKAFNIPIVILPQSFGPFDYADDSDINKRIKELLPYAKYICAREKEGFRLLTEKYHLANVVLKPDIVLQNTSADYRDIFKKKVHLEIPDVDQHSVAIIPNDNIMKLLGKDNAISLYSCMIKRVLSYGYSVFIIMHSTFDKDLCEQIWESLKDNERVHYLSRDYSCVEFDEMIGHFDFCIASRYHSIVHSFRNGVPCIVLGWAEKYRELLSVFDQKQYLFDVRDSIDYDDILPAIETIDKNHQGESQVINQRLKNIQQDNAFDLLGGVLKTNEN